MYHNRNFPFATLYICILWSTMWRNGKRKRQIKIYFQNRIVIFQAFDPVYHMRDFSAQHSSSFFFCFFFFGQSSFWNNYGKSSVNKNVYQNDKDLNNSYRKWQQNTSVYFNILLQSYKAYFATHTIFHAWSHDSQ